MYLCASNYVVTIIGTHKDACSCTYKSYGMHQIVSIRVEGHDFNSGMTKRQKLARYQRENPELQKVQ